MTKTRIYLALLMAGLLFTPLRAHAGASMMISSSGPGEFALFGSQMNDIVAMHVFINYDVSSMSNTSASATGILLAHCRVTSKTTDGTIEISATGSEPIGEYGNVVVITFDPASDEVPGVINSASVYLTESSGRQSSVPVVINNPKPRPKDPEATPDRWTAAKEAAAKAAEAGTAGEAATVRETSGVPGTSPERPATGEGASLAKVIERSRAGSEPRPDVAYKVHVCSGLLDRARNAGAGNKAAPPLPQTAGEPDCSYRQEPGALLSDGKSGARIVMEFEVKGDKAPNFFITGAHCLALKQTVGAWELELVPLPGALEASVSALYDGMMVVFPLTVAPPIDVYRKKRPTSAGAVLDAYVQQVNSMVQNLAEGRP
jgi:hypothetical protein